MLCSTTLAIGAMLIAAASDAPSATYTLTIPESKDRVHVEAEIIAQGAGLEIIEGSYSEGVPGGLAGFVEDLQVTRADGSSVSVTGPESGHWRVDAPDGERIHVRYQVRLDHDKARWRFGSDEVAYVREDSVFFVSRSVLLVHPGIRDALVRFVVPAEWRVATPWRPVDGQPFTYNPANLRMLSHACVIAGQFIEYDVRAGDTVITLAVGQALAPYAPKLEAALQACLPAFREVFNEAPLARFLAVFHSNPAGGITNGSAYPNSISVITPQRMEGANYDIAIYTLAHEVLHLWNGYRMRPAKQMEWFTEGFTDYLTWRVLADAGLASEEAILRELSRQLTAYSNAVGSASIAGAGAQKAKNKVLVYEGGSLVALCLDSLIRERSDGARGVGDFLREMYARSALKDTQFDEATIIAVATELTGEDFAPFFERHIRGMEPLPLDERLKAMGLRADRKTAGDRIDITAAPRDSARGGAAKARDTFLGRD